MEEDEFDLASIDQWTPRSAGALAPPHASPLPAVPYPAQQQHHHQQYPPTTYYPPPPQPPMGYPDPSGGRYSNAHNNMQHAGGGGTAGHAYAHPWHVSPPPAYYQIHHPLPPPPYFSPQPPPAAVRQPAEVPAVAAASCASACPPSSSAAMDHHGPSPPAATGPSASSGHQQPQSLRRPSALQKVQQWQQHYSAPTPTPAPPHDSGVQSMSHGTANSVMSSSMQPLSCMSAMSSLPDEFGSTMGDHPYFQHIPSGLRNEDPDTVQQWLPDLLQLINDECEEVVLRALNIIRGIAKKDRGRRPVEVPLIRDHRVVEELLRILHKHRKNKRVLNYALCTLHFISDTDTESGGRNLFVHVLDTHGAQALREVVHCVSVPDQSCFKYAFLVLHDLLSERRCAARVHAYLCEQRTLTQVLGWLGGATNGDTNKINEKCLNIITDIVQKLVTKSSEQMAFFIGLNGHQKLINLAASCQEEPLLWRVTKLLDKVAQMDSERMVAAGVLEALQRHLDHPSQRLVRQTLACIRSVSHVRACGEHDIQPLLHRLLQLLGTSDLRLKEACADSLANLCANNTSIKTFLVQSGAVPALFQLLQELDGVRNAPAGASAYAAQQQDDAFQRQLEGIQETALTLLKSLGAAAGTGAKQHILASDDHKRLLLHKLREWHFGLLRKTLQLLLQLANSPDPVLLAQLRFSVTLDPPLPQFPADASSMAPSGGGHCSFASQCVLLLQQLISLLPDAAELCRLCLDTLRAMCRDPPLLEEIYAELRHRRMRATDEGQRLLIPQLLVCFCDQLAPNAIGLLAELARIPEAAQLIARHGPSLEVLRRWAGIELQHNEQKPPQVQAVQAAANLLQMLGIPFHRQQQPRAGEELSGMGLLNNIKNNTPSSMDCSNSMDLVPQPSCSTTETSTKTNSAQHNSALLYPTTSSAGGPAPIIPCADELMMRDTNGTAGNNEQLAQFGTIEDMQDLSLGPSVADDLSDSEFGLLINALCPNSSPTLP